MEIINTIWTALTTENEMLTNIIISPLALLEATFAMLLFSFILNIGCSRKQAICYVASFSIIANLTNILIPKPFNSTINILAYLFLIILIFKLKFFKALMAVLIPNIIFVLVGIIVQNIYISIFSISTEFAISTPIHKITLSLLVYLFVYIIYVLLKKFKINITLFENMKKKSNLILIIDFIIGIITISIQSYVFSIYSDILPFGITLLNISILLIYFSFNFYALIRTNKLEITTQDLEQSRQYNKTLEILHDNIRGFKHDLSNIMTTIGGYIQTGDMEKLRKFYNGLQADFNEINNLNILSPSVINEPAVYCLLTNKYYLAESKGITVNLEIFIDLRELRIKIYEFTRILGILMDNAIEAASECNEKIINVVIRKDFHSERQLLIIENTYLNKQIDTEKIYEKGYSTKEHNTGIGLWEVRTILKKNENLNLFTSKNEKFFSQQLEIY